MDRNRIPSCSAINLCSQSRSCIIHDGKQSALKIQISVIGQTKFIKLRELICHEFELKMAAKSHQYDLCDEGISISVIKTCTGILLSNILNEVETRNYMWRFLISLG